MSFNYVFVTYGSKRIKGVQTKAINISKYLPKNEVLVINHGDSSWLERAGLSVYKVDFNVFANPSSIDVKLWKYLSHAKVIVFCDFPSNMPLEMFIFSEVMHNLSVPICICDNIYNSRQFEIKTYSMFYNHADLFLLSGLTYFEQYLERFPKAKLIPPFFNNPEHDEQYYKNAVLKQIGKEDLIDPLVLHIAYNAKVFDISRILVKETSHLSAHHIIITDPTFKVPVRDHTNVTHIAENLTIDQMKEFILGCDITICKFGYQQLLESLSLFRPTIAVGDSGLEKNWLDDRIQSNFSYHESYSDQLLSELIVLIRDRSKRKLIQSRLSALHNGTYEGGKKAAQAILTLTQQVIVRKHEFKKNIALSFNTPRNVRAIKKIMQREESILPIMISGRFAERDFGIPKEINIFTIPFEEYVDLPPQNRHDFLNSSALLHLQLSPVAYHGLINLFPFIPELLNSIETLARSSDKIYIVGIEAKSFFKHIIQEAEQNKKELVFLEL